ncbi:nucleoside/nucleotide kinase family protein [Roseitranquillus sediminis]|uniref:nucleoside/nucleotide kinase family protein n=1 Tax=Roseitranquillus sediminis TaxID=2809051 RepID=UPI001D0C539C|nr:nucleoside/nucleotide kinase family protein [Roseitranquillus sediminis]MBM9593383.1 nucleoside/nucleotide kinase family protein [Roseitranquillus sediminis]
MDHLDEIVRRIGALDRTAGRTLVAVAGPPASGKSTLAERLVDRLGERAILVPMDGFHLDNIVLERRGLLARKGAPETFDADGFAASVRRIRTEAEVVLPAFDRARDIAVAGRVVVEPRHEVVVFEGNYLCFDAEPWRTLSEVWDLSIFLDVSEAVLLQRLVQRWLDHGLAPDAARRRAEENDMRNARLVLRSRTSADLVLTAG